MSVLNTLKLRIFCGVGFIVLVVYVAGLVPFIVNIYLDVVMPLPDTPEAEEIAYEASLNASRLIAFYGYPVEEHVVETDDGYLLGVQRIPNHGSKKKPVLIMHGMSCSSSSWVDNRNESLGFILADEGFDVWLGNFRGNANSLRHVTITHEDSEFWDFSIDKLAFYDMPATIDYILNKTKKDKILLVSHSMGSTASMGAFIVRPEYNERVHGFVGIAPVATVGYINSAVYKLVPVQELLLAGANLLDIPYLYKSTPLHSEIVKHMCGGSSEYWCSSMVPTISGYNPHYYNKSRIPIYTAHCSSGLSVKIFFHFGQMVRSKDFRFYDYKDETENILKYGSKSPPLYNLSLVTVPTALIWSDNDALADPLDVALLLKTLPNVVVNYHIPDPMFNHYNFMWTFNMRTRLANKLIETLNGFDELNKSKP